MTSKDFSKSRTMSSGKALRETEKALMEDTRMRDTEAKRNPEKSLKTVRYRYQLKYLFCMNKDFVLLMIASATVI